MKFIIYLVISMATLVVAKAGFYIDEKTLTETLLLGLYALIGMLFFYKFSTDIAEFKLFKNKLLNLFWQLNGFLIMISLIFFIDYMNYITIQFVVLMIIGGIIQFIEEIKQKKSKKSTKA